MKHLLVQGSSMRKGHKLAGRAQCGGMEGCSKGFNPQNTPPRPTHALAAVFLSIEQLWELGLNPICISVAAQEKPRHAQELRTELQLQNVLYPSPVMAGAGFPTPQGHGAGSVGNTICCSQGPNSH